jgi:hypothetical protein
MKIESITKMETNKTKERLQKKMNKKKAASGEANSSAGSSGQVAQPNIFDMLSQVGDSLKKNPALINKVNSCVSKIIDNPDIMSKISSEIQTNINFQQEFGAVAAETLGQSSEGSSSEGPDQSSGQDQTLASSSPTDEPAALE